MSLPPGQRLGAYEVGTKIGEGGMGQVYRARDVKLGRDVAIKILPASVSQDPDRLGRFEREAQAVASLSHPNVVSLFEFGAHDGQPFVVMELLEGQTLRDALVSGPLTGRATGEPESVSANVEAAMDQPSLSADGRTMVFRSLLQSVNPMALSFDPVTERAGTPKALTARTGVLNKHSVSPDNQWLLLGNQGEIREDLFVMRVDGTGLRRLTDDMPRDRSPRWAPDGKSIVFYSNRDGAYAIFSIRPDGSNLTRLTEPAKRDAYYPDLSPVDGTLVYADDNFQSFFFAPPFARGGSPRPAMGLEVDGGVMQLTAWSPDGRLISGPVVSRASGNPIGVGTYEVATQKGTKLADDAGQWSVPFLPDGKRLIYVTTGGELVVVDTATRQRRVVRVALGGPVNSESYAIAPDGRTIFYGAHRQEANVWMVTPR